MIFSKFHVDIRSPQGRNCIRDCQKMHRSIMRLFHCARKDGNILYRLNPDKMDVYILSEKAPDLQDLPTGMIPLGQKDMSDLEQKMTEGRKYRFNILVAPAKKVAENGVKNSRRRYLRTAQERLAWLQRKADQAGFALLDAQENADMSIYGKHSEEVGGSFYSHAVCYQGMLEVTDREKFCMAWKQGIGSGRAYGQGLLLLARL